jgi:hypothetical protein
MSATATPVLPRLPDTFTSFKAPAPESKQAIQKVRYSHDAMIDMIVGNPWISQGELARNFGYTEGWVSQVIASDAFQARLAQRKNDLIDPHLRATIDERFKGLVVRSIEILMRKLDAPTGQVSDELALKALEVASKAAGYGAKSAQVQVNTQFVVQVPGKSASSADWEREHGAGESLVTSSPLAKAAQIADAEVLVASESAAPSTKDLLAELKEKG